MADDGVVHDALAQRADQLRLTPLVTGSVPAEAIAAAGIRSIEIFYKVDRRWMTFELLGRLRSSITELREACDEDDSINGAYLVTSLDLSGLGILGAAKRFISTADNEFALAQLAKVTVYTPESWVPPVWRNEGDHAAALVVLLPTAFEGGDLAVKSPLGNTIITHAWSNNRELQWAAIRKGCRYRFRPITSGSFVVLTYWIFARPVPPEVVAEASVELTEFLTEARRVVESEIVIGFPCKNLYHKALVERFDADRLVQMLQGEDAVIYEAARSAQLQVEVVRLWQNAERDNIFIDRALNGFEVSRYIYEETSDYHRIDRMIQLSRNPRTVEREDITWASNDHKWLPGACHMVHTDNGEISAMGVNCAAAILVTVPKDRA